MIQSNLCYQNILIVLDAVSAGCIARSLEQFTNTNKVVLFAPRTFEYLILSSKMMNSYASSFDHKIGYFTAEDDYKEQLESITSHKIYTYHKDHLNKCYCEDCCRIKDYEHAKCECLCYGNKFRIILGKYCNLFWFADTDKPSNMNPKWT